jgi:hypothetical protein
MKLLSILLTVLFIGLKLTDTITWSWVLVLSPLLIYIGINLIIITISLIIIYFANIVKVNKRKKLKEDLHYK